MSEAPVTDLYEQRNKANAPGKKLVINGQLFLLREGYIQEPTIMTTNDNLIVKITVRNVNLFFFKFEIL